MVLKGVVMSICESVGDSVELLSKQARPMAWSNSWCGSNCGFLFFALWMKWERAFWILDLDLWFMSLSLSGIELECGCTFVWFIFGDVIFLDEGDGFTSSFRAVVGGTEVAEADVSFVGPVTVGVHVFFSEVEDDTEVITLVESVAAHLDVSSDFASGSFGRSALFIDVHDVNTVNAAEGLDVVGIELFFHFFDGFVIFEFCLSECFGFDVFALVVEGVDDVLGDFEFFGASDEGYVVVGPGFFFEGDATLEEFLWVFDFVDHCVALSIGHTRVSSLDIFFGRDEHVFYPYLSRFGVLAMAHATRVIMRISFSIGLL